MSGCAAATLLILGIVMCFIIPPLGIIMLLMFCIIASGAGT